MNTIIPITINNRRGTAESYLGGMTTETYEFSGDIPAEGLSCTLFRPDGQPLATGTTTAGGFCEMDTNTQEVADSLRFQPVGATSPVVIMIGDADNILAVIHAELMKNWLDSAETHPPVPLPKYWTREQVQAAIAEAVQNKADTSALSAVSTALADETTRATTAETQLREDVSAIADRSATIEALLAEMQAAAKQTTADATQTAADRVATETARTAAENSAMEAKFNAAQTETALTNCESALQRAETAAETAETHAGTAAIDANAANAHRIAAEEAQYASEENALSTQRDVHDSEEYTRRSETAANEAETHAQQTAADAEDSRGYMTDAQSAAREAEEALALVPAIALDTAALRDASFDLVGTDSETLVNLSENL